MKNILILSASPRKNGNSDILCHQFMKGAEDAGNEGEGLPAGFIKEFHSVLPCSRM